MQRSIYTQFGHQRQVSEGSLMVRVADIRPGNFFKFPNGQYPAFLFQFQGQPKKATYLHSGMQACVNENTMVIPLRQTSPGVFEPISGLFV